MVFKYRVKSTVKKAKISKPMAKSVKSIVKKELNKVIETKVATFGQPGDQTYTSYALNVWQSVVPLEPFALKEGTESDMRIGNKIHCKYIEISLAYYFQGYAGYIGQRSRLLILQARRGTNQVSIQDALDYIPLPLGSTYEGMDTMRPPTVGLLDLCYVLKDITFLNGVNQVQYTGIGDPVTLDVQSIHNPQPLHIFKVKPRIQPIWDDSDDTEENPTVQGAIYCYHLTEGVLNGEQTLLSTPWLRVHASTHYQDA